MRILIISSKGKLGQNNVYQISSASLTGDLDCVQTSKLKSL